MSYVAIDTQGARALGQVLQDSAVRVESVRRSVSTALNFADLASQAPAQLALVQDGFTRLAAGVMDKATLAEQYVIDPQATSASLGAPVEALGAALGGLLGFSGPADLRALLIGLPPPGANPALDGALARLNPVLLPAFQSGQRPELTEAQAADLRLLAVALGIEHAGPPIAPVNVDGQFGNELLARRFGQIQPVGHARTGTEVFWNDFWADGRTVDSVLADPKLLLEWVSGTFELDRRLAMSAGLPSLTDVLASVDFATKGSDPAALAENLAAAETEFAAIADWLPAFLMGLDQSAPDATQLAQTLAFAARVGWPDPGAGTASQQDRFADAIAFLRANRALQSALLPTGFEGDPDPLAFFNGPGIGFVLDHGFQTGVLDGSVLQTIAGTVDQALASFGVDMSGATPVTLTEQVQQQLFALLGAVIPRSALETPAIQAQFIAALGYLRSAANGPEQRQRLIEVLAAFRTLVIIGAPALTERQLIAAVGGTVQDVLGRSRLRLRSQDAVRKNPQLFLLARQWGVPGDRKEDLGKFKYSWSFNDLGELTGLRLKKKSWLSQAWDTVKAVGEAIWKSWEDNPLKAIFQVGKLALGAIAFVVPGLQVLGAAAFSLSLGEAAFHAVQGDWLSAIGAGLSAFTAGATDVFSGGALPTIVDTYQADFVKSLVSTGMLDGDTLDFLKNAKRVFDIGTSIYRATQADTLVGAIGAGLSAATFTLGSGGQLLGKLGLAGSELVADLGKLGLSVADVTRLVAPAARLAGGNQSVLAAFGDGLALLAGGARLLLNPRGAFAGTDPVAGEIFKFEPQTAENLRLIAQTTGVAAGVARAIDAANHGNTFLAGTFLAQAVQALNDPTSPLGGGKAAAAERIAEIGVLLEAVFEKKASPNAVAPLVMQRLQAVFDALNTQPRTGAQLGAQGGARVGAQVGAQLGTGSAVVASANAAVVGASSVLAPAFNWAPVVGTNTALSADMNTVLAASTSEGLLPPSAPAALVPPQSFDNVVTAALVTGDSATTVAQEADAVILLAANGSRSLPPVRVSSEPLTETRLVADATALAGGVGTSTTRIVTAAALAALTENDPPNATDGANPNVVLAVGDGNTDGRPIVLAQLPGGAQRFEPPRLGLPVVPVPDSSSSSSGLIVDPPTLMAPSTRRTLDLPSFVEWQEGRPVLRLPGLDTIPDPLSVLPPEYRYIPPPADFSWLDLTESDPKPGSGPWNIGISKYGGEFWRTILGSGPGARLMVGNYGPGGGGTLIYDPETGKGALILHIGYGQADSISWGQGMRPPTDFAIGFQGIWTDSQLTGLNVPPNAPWGLAGQPIWHGVTYIAKYGTDQISFTANPWVGGTQPFAGTEFSFVFRDGGWQPDDWTGITGGWAPVATRRISLYVVIPFTLDASSLLGEPVLGPPLLAERYSGELRDLAWQSLLTRLDPSFTPTAPAGFSVFTLGGEMRDGQTVWHPLGTVSGTPSDFVSVPGVSLWQPPPATLMEHYAGENLQRRIAAEAAEAVTFSPPPPFTLWGELGGSMPVSVPAPPPPPAPPLRLEDIPVVPPAPTLGEEVPVRRMSFGADDEAESGSVGVGVGSLYQSALFTGGGNGSPVDNVDGWPTTPYAAGNLSPYTASFVTGVAGNVGLASFVPRDPGSVNLPDPGQPPRDPRDPNLVPPPLDLDPPLLVPPVRPEWDPNLVPPPLDLDPPDLNPPDLNPPDLSRWDVGWDDFGPISDFDEYA